MILLTFLLFFIIARAFLDDSSILFQFEYQSLQYIISLIKSITPSWYWDQIMNSSSVFNTTAQVLAVFMAIVFSISLFVIQSSSDKYTPKIRNYFKENLRTNQAFGLGLLTIFVCVLFLALDLNSAIAIGIVLFLLIITSLFFYFYYNQMVKIIDPYGIADLLGKECIDSVVNKKLEDVKDIIATISDVTIRSLRVNDEALTIKYCQTFIKIYYDLHEIKLTTRARIEIETLLFNEIFRSFRFAVDNKDSSRMFLVQIIFDAIQYEAGKTEPTCGDEVDLIISRFLFDFNRYAINKGDFDFFKTMIHHISLLNVHNPRLIQEDIQTSLYKGIQPVLFYYNKEVYQKILNEIKCLEYLLKYLAIKDFSSLNALAVTYELYEKNLEKYIFSITKSEELIEKLAKMHGTDRDGILKMVESTINLVNVSDRSDYFCLYRQMDLLLISLKLHLTFYRLGAFIIFTGKQEQINSAQYLKELWDHTCPDDACAIICNESPTLFDPLWLTYIHFYGGQNDQYWVKTKFGFSLGYDNYHGAETYLYHYYLLTITRCIQRGNSSLTLPSFEELDNLKVNEPFKFTELYEFTKHFKIESADLLSHCDKLIQDAHRWDLLFDNRAEESLIKTKEWIQDNVITCEKISVELKKRMIIDNGKILYYSQKVLEEYRNTSIVDQLAAVKKFDEVTDSGLNFIHIYKYIEELDKRLFFKDDSSHPDHIFIKVAQVISRGEIDYILETIKDMDSIGIIELKEIHKEAVLSKIKELCYRMRDSGFNPSAIIMPIELKKSLAIDRYGAFSLLKIDEDISLNIISSNNHRTFNDLAILDKSAGVWTYKPSNNTEERISVEFTPNEENELLMKILVKTTVNYSIVNSDAIKKIKFDLSVVSQSA